MGRFTYICCIFSLILIVGIGCKSKKPVSEEAAPAAADKAEAAPSAADKAEVAQMVADKADAQNAEAKPENAADNNIQADSQDNKAGKASDAENTAPAVASKKCEKWGTNPLFVDGHELVYDVKKSQQACCNLDEDEAGWECDEDGDCTKESAYEMKCKISLIQAESFFCASKLTCLNSAGEDVDITNEYAEFDYSLAGYWMIDSNGLYHLDSDDKLSLNKQAKPGDCKKTKYVLCNPETLAYEYAEFSNAEPLISFVKYKEMDIDTDNDDEDFTSSLTVTHKGSTWERKDEASGSDEFSQSVLFDETRGITEFKTHFAGGSESDTTVKLR